MEPVKSLMAALFGAGSVLPRQRLVDLVNTRYLSQAICVANKWRIANVVTANVPVHTSEVAKQLQCHETNLYRLMSYLAAYGVFEEKEGHFFVGNELSETMREDSPSNCHKMLLLDGRDEYWESIVKMDRALDKDNEKTPFELVYGEPFYSHLEHNPEQQQVFDLGVANNTAGWQGNIPSYYDFTRYNSIVDVAGGRGGLLKAILGKCPNVRGTLFEQPFVIEHTLPELLTETRFRSVSGNFFEKIDVAANLFMIARTLHCFQDSQLAVILRNFASAMHLTPGCRLLIIEVDYEKSFQLNTPSHGRNADMRMMLVTGGYERDLNSWQSVLKAQGIKVLQKIPFPPNFMGLECELA